MPELDTSDRPLLTWVFFDREMTLRSGWRFFMFLTLFIFATAIVGGFAGAILRALPVESDPDDLLIRVGGSVLSLGTALVVGWICARFLENLPFRSLGAWFTKGWLKDFWIGILFGAISLSVAALIAFVGGGMTFRLNSTAGSTAILITFGVTFLIFIFGAAFEEAFVRGYMFQTFTRAGLAWLAILITSVVFAAGHLGNEGAGVFSTTNTALAGVWLGIAYLKTRTLWFVTGIHFAWNWVQGSFYGIEVSGFDRFATAPLLREVDAGPAWLTGGEYGLEGGMACTVALVLSTVAIWYFPFLRAEEEMVSLTSPSTKEPTD